MKRFAVLDIDGTLIRWQLYHAIADTLAKRGLIEPIIYKSIRDARMTWKRRTHPESFKDYEKRLIDAYDMAITRLDPGQYEEATEAVFSEYKAQVYTYTRNLTRQLKKRGYLLFAISGSQVEIIEKIARYWGFDDWVGSFYHRSGEKFSGTKIIASAVKAKVLKELMRKHQVTTAGSVAVGDSASDIAMLKIVEHPIAFNPERTLFEHAREHGWQIVVERKNMVYRLKNTPENINSLHPRVFKDGSCKCGKYGLVVC